jgi:hypothetical protein
LLDGVFAEHVGIGFEFPTQSSVVAPNAPKKSTNLSVVSVAQVIENFRENGVSSS